MHQYCLRPAIWGVALLVAVPLAGSRLMAQVEEQLAPPAMPGQEQPEVLNRGPVHEAFAEPVNMQYQAGLVAPAQPPPNIDEVPPPYRPQGQQFVWIPGYWSWDAERNGYIWVSACWRVAPPRMSWVPGYWAQVPGGWEWIAGFWAPAGVREIEYLAAPPAIDVLEPDVPAPSPETIWVPPCMYWVQGQYVRRHGYWLAAQPNWVWVPSHYIATPRGYIFAAGHWDYSLERRGMLFAPVYFPAGIYRRPAYSYSPSIVIDVGLLRVSLFAYPRYCHYYFGDYYDDAYLRIGIFPWFDSQRLHTWYDPIYEHDRWQHQRAEPQWAERERSEYNRRRADKDLRPARTFREQESRTAKLPEPQRRAFQVTQPMSVAIARRETTLKFERIDSDARQAISRQATAVRTFSDQRDRWEAPAANPRTVSQPVNRNAAVPIPAERQATIQPSRDRQPFVPQAGERTETVQPVRDRKPAATPAIERTQTVQPPRERQGSGTAPSDRNQPAPMPVKREPAFVPPRVVNAPQPERVQIPAPTVVGGSGSQGIFQRGPPSRPADEDKNKDSRENSSDRDARKGGNDRPGPEPSSGDRNPNAR